MSDRLKGIVVTFKNDIKDEDAEDILTAIRMVKGVLSVKPLITNYEQHIAEERVRHEIHKQLFDIVYPDRHKEK